MEYVFMILKRDLRSLLVPSGKKGLKSRLTFYLGVVLFLALGVAVGYGSYKLFAYLEATLSVVPAVKTAIEINVLNGISLFMLIMVFLTGIQTTYKTIYESDDIGFLMAQPVPVQSIFVAKFLTAYATLAATVLVIGLPAWLGYGVSIKAGPLFYLLALLLLALLLLVAHSLVAFLLLVAMKYLPGRKMKQLFIASSAIFGVLLVLLSQMASAQIQRTEDPSKMLEMIGRGQLERTWYLPSTWMVNAVLGTFREFGLNPLPYAMALVVSSVGLSTLAVRVSRGWFLAGWAGRTEETAVGVVKKRSRGRGSSLAVHSTLPSGTYWTVLRKDLRLLFRDPLVWYNLVIGVIVVGFFIFNMKSQSSSPGFGGQDSVVLGSVVTMMSVMMGSVAGAQTGGISVSREGASFWLVRGNPVDARGFFGAKITYALLPPAVLFALSVVAISLSGLPHGSMGMVILMGASMVVTVASVQILLDVFFPDFTLKVEFGSSKSGRGTGKLITTMLGSMVMVFALSFLLLLPTTQIPRRLFPGITMRTATLASQVAVVGIGVLIGGSAVIFGVKRMRRILSDM